MHIFAFLKGFLSIHRYYLFCFVLQFKRGPVSPVEESAVQWNRWREDHKRYTEIHWVRAKQTGVFILYWSNQTLQHQNLSHSTRPVHTRLHSRSVQASWEKLLKTKCFRENIHLISFRVGKKVSNEIMLIPEWFLSRRQWDSIKSKLTLPLLK